MIQALQEFFDSILFIALLSQVQKLLILLEIFKLGLEQSQERLI